MNPIFRLTGIAILTVATFVAGIGIIGGGKADASGTTAECAFYGVQYVCEYKNPDGIQSIHLVWHHHVLGDIDLVDEEYRDCPTSVVIGPWDDSVYGEFTLDVTPCDRDTSEGRGGFGLKASDGRDDLGFKLQIVHDQPEEEPLGSFRR